MTYEPPNGGSEFDPDEIAVYTTETYSHWNPAAVLIIGSRARSTARHANDLDICVLGDIERTRTARDTFEGLPMHVVGLSVDDTKTLLARPHLIHWEFTRIYIAEWLVNGIICYDTERVAADLRATAKEWLRSDDLKRFVGGKLSYAQIVLESFENGEIPRGLPGYLAAARIAIHLFDVNLLVDGRLYTGEKHIRRLWSELGLNPTTYEQLEMAFRSGTLDDIVDTLQAFLEETRSRYEDGCRVTSGWRSSEE